MKSSFHGWATMGNMDIDVIANYILTGKTAEQTKPDFWLMNNAGDPNRALKVLDFGCGLGRNSYALAKKAPKWSILGYDNDGMLSNRDKFYNIHYSDPQPTNLHFSSDWDSIKTRKFDLIFAVLVFQHIHENDIRSYIGDIKGMTHKLIVSGRRFNDDVGNRSVWTIFEEQGLIPTLFYKEGKTTPYISEGDPHEHHIAVYYI